MPTLIVCQDAHDYRVIDFVGSVTIGRENDNDLVLASPQVSRHHASVAQRENGDYMLFDHESTNGVWMEQRRVNGVRLGHGASFRITNFSFTFLDEQHDDRPSKVFASEGESGPPARQRPLDSATVLFNRGSDSAAEAPAVERPDRKSVV